MFVNGLLFSILSPLYSSMIKNRNLTVSLAIISLLGMLLIQGYFLKSDFVRNKESFTSDVNTSLELIIDDVERDRDIRKYKLHRQDLMDTNIVNIEFDMKEGIDPVVTVTDSKTNVKILSMQFTNTYNVDTLTEEYLFERAFGSMLNDDPGKRIYFSLGTIIDTKLSSYQDTLSVNHNLLDSLLTNNLMGYGIQANYQVTYLPLDSTYKAKKGEVVTDFFEVTDKKEKVLVGVVVSNPFWHIINRSRAVVLASVFVMLLVVLSYIFFTRTITRQQNLAQTKDDFIDNVTHELLTPISTLSISLESLDRYNALDDKKKAHDYLKISKMELNRISGLVQNVLQVSLHNSGVVTLKMTDTDLTRVLRDVIDYYTIKSGGDLSFEIDFLEEIRVIADVYHLNNVLYNLVDNAVNYSNRKPHRISFKAFKEHGKVFLEVKDNGFGIPKEDRNKIFDKFHRVSQKGVQEVKGMGIGLYYAKSIMNRMGGDLTLKESSENGSVFCLRLRNGQMESND